jgi:signal peptidase I
MNDQGYRRYRGRRVASADNKGSVWKDILTIVVAAAVALVVFRVVLQLAWVPSGSMENTIPTRSLLVGFRLPYLVGDPEVERGDIVTFWGDELDKLLVKRVIGVAGDEISFKDGYVYINGQKSSEPYLKQQGITTVSGNKTFRVPEGCLFMMGDNRGSSDDGRYWNDPYVELEDVKAKVWAIVSVHKENSWRGVRAAG